MLVDLSSGSAGEWFTFRMSHINENTGEVVWGEPIEGVRVKIRSLKPFFEERLSKRERIVEWKLNPKTRQNEKHSNFKELTVDEIKAERDDGYDYAIMELEGFKDKKSKLTIESTRQNKLAMMKLDFFERFFGDCQQTIDTLSVEFEKALEKNS